MSGINVIDGVPEDHVHLKGSPAWGARCAANSVPHERALIGYREWMSGRWGQHHNRAPSFKGIVILAKDVRRLGKWREAAEAELKAARRRLCDDRIWARANPAYKSLDYPPDSATVVTTIKGLRSLPTYRDGDGCVYQDSTDEALLRASIQGRLQRFRWARPYGIDSMDAIQIVDGHLRISTCRDQTHPYVQIPISKVDLTTLPALVKRKAEFQRACVADKK
ncbi:MAG: hypothetical protein AB7I45_01430 [Planctomycetota bacterium]